MIYPSQPWMTKTSTLWHGTDIQIRSLLSCDTNAGGTIRPRGDQSLYLPSTELDNFPADLVVKTSCGARFKMGLVIRGTKTNIRNPVLTYLGKNYYCMYITHIFIWLWLSLQDPSCGCYSTTTTTTTTSTASTTTTTTAATTTQIAQFGNTVGNDINWSY